MVPAPHLYLSGACVLATWSNGDGVASTLGAVGEILHNQGDSLIPWRFSSLSGICTPIPSKLLEREFVAVHQLDSTSWRSKCWTKFAMSSRARLYVCFTTFTIVQQLTAFVQDFDGQRRAELFATLFLALTGVSNTRTNRIEIELQANPSRR